MKKILFLSILLGAMLFTTGCYNTTKYSLSSSNQSNKQKIEQLEKNDNYVPWWKK